MVITGSSLGAYVTNTSGSAIIGNGCYGDPGYAIILVACITELDMQDSSFYGFPSRRCNSSWGICTSTQNVLIQPLYVCNQGSWLGNFNIESWDPASGPEYSMAGLRLPSMSLLLLLFIMIMAPNNALVRPESRKKNGKDKTQFRSAVMKSL